MTRSTQWDAARVLGADPALQHARPEHQPLQDAAHHLKCAQTALAAAVHHRPEPGQQLGLVHAVLSDQLHELEEVAGGAQ